MAKPVLGGQSLHVRHARRRPLSPAARQVRDCLLAWARESECPPHSMAGYTSKLIPPEHDTEDIDALHPGQGGLRDPADVTDPLKRQVLTRLRAKHGYTD